MDDITAINVLCMIEAHGDIYIKSEWYGDIGCASVRLSDGYTTEFGSDEVVAKVECNCEVL